uniref:DEFENSIN domain-containing protein n=1 Tax=Macrostomum lignano TaxID=282301 RepID=A0A1I8JNI4_9PLAT
RVPLPEGAVRAPQGIRGVPDPVLRAQHSHCHPVLGVLLGSASRRCRHGSRWKRRCGKKR